MLSENGPLHEVVYRDDVESLQEDVLSLWKATYRTVERLRAQGAPESLVSAMTEANDMLSKSFRTLQGAAPYFPGRGK